MVGPHETQELGLPRKGQEVHGQQERDHFAVAEAGLGPSQALPPAGRVGLVPVVHPDVHLRGQILECYTARHGEPPECRLCTIACILRGFPFLSHPPPQFHIRRIMDTQGKPPAQRLVNGQRT